LPQPSSPYPIHYTDLASKAPPKIICNAILKISTSQAEYVGDVTVFVDITELERERWNGDTDTYLKKKLNIITLLIGSILI
jgi:hypothetical protein